MFKERIETQAFDEEIPSGSIFVMDVEDLLYLEIKNLHPNNHLLCIEKSKQITTGIKKELKRKNLFGRKALAPGLTLSYLREEGIKEVVKSKNLEDFSWVANMSEEDFQLARSVLKILVD